ncbi:ATP-binding domain-containing protein [Clostridium sp. AN503]|uniref:DEAD/DEAH box helicase n=1 Tax=Clostridium sp. AN503 TaxID=3160598 RepID=UPI00345960EF
MTENLKILGALEDSIKYDIAERFVQTFISLYPDVKGELYLGYPIYVDEIANRRVCVDLALVSKIGVYILNILPEPVTDYGMIQDDIYAKVESKFKKQNFLFRKRKLIFDFYTVTYTPTSMVEEDGYPLVHDISELMDFIKENKEDQEFTDDLYEKILSGIQEAYGINTHRERGNVRNGTKAFAIGQLANQIEKYDGRQMEAILSDTAGIQRIRGMAGSGKTIVLARKAVELHTAHPEWDIVVTYSTRSLRNQLISLIGRFYSAKNDGAKYNEEKLKVMQSWGSASSKGVYYEICLRHGMSPLNVGEAKAKYGNGANIFSKLCGDLLKSIKDFHKMYDCILIDEAQDFDKNYLQLCLKVLDNNQRLVYAYDELQKLNEEAMPNPEQIFGRNIDHDTPLTVCYRNQGNAIVTAHAIGMGLYSEDGILQLPSSSSVWTAIGYSSDTPILEGKKVTLYRTKETSPELLKVNPDEIIRFLSYDSGKVMYTELLKMIKQDLEVEQLLPGDIMIIDMDTFGYSTNRIRLSSIQDQLNFEAQDAAGWDNEKEEEYDFNLHTAGAANPEDFFRDDSVVYASVRRAKGNETFMIYIVNAQKCVNSLQRRSDRNGLFTAITRSKGWVRVLGYGEDMEILNQEFEKIKKHDFKLYFEEYPDKEKQKQIFLNNKDVEAKDIKTIGNTKILIDKLTVEGNVSKLQLMQELFGMSKEELLEEITKQAGGEEHENV